MNNYDDVFLDLGEQNEEQNFDVLNFFPDFIVYFYSRCFFSEEDALRF